MIYIVDGDISKATQVAIGHQTNCQSKMGAGAALAIRKAFPVHYIDFIDDDRKPEDKFGSCIFTECGDKLIFGIYGQLYYGRDKQYTDYKMQYRAVEDMIEICVSKGITEIALPFGIGCNLAGGDFSIVLKNIEELSTKHNIDIYLYRYQ
jgi:O-acetyl-ADP-ribose deacetylase (regulator of RNase III)